MDISAVLLQTARQIAQEIVAQKVALVTVNEPCTRQPTSSTKRKRDTRCYYTYISNMSGREFAVFDDKYITSYQKPTRSGFKIVKDITLQRERSDFDPKKIIPGNTSSASVSVICFVFASYHGYTPRGIVSENKTKGVYADPIRMGLENGDCHLLVLVDDKRKKSYKGLHCPQFAIERSYTDD